MRPNKTWSKSIPGRAQSERYFSMRECARRAGVSYCTMKRYVKKGFVYPRIETSDKALGYRYWFNEADVQRVREVVDHNMTWMPIALREAIERQRGG